MEKRVYENTPMWTLASIFQDQVRSAYISCFNLINLGNLGQDLYRKDQQSYPVNVINFSTRKTDVA